MSTDGPDPPPCDPKISEEGECLFVTHTIPSNSMEAWVKSVAKDSGQPVDWHFVGGRAVILALGDLDRVKASIRKLMSDHDARFAKALEKYPHSTGVYHPPRPGWWHGDPSG